MRSYKCAHRDFVYALSNYIYGKFNCDKLLDVPQPADTRNIIQEAIWEKIEEWKSEESIY